MAGTPKTSKLIDALAAKIPSKRGPKPANPTSNSKSRVSKTFRLDGDILNAALALAWHRDEQLTVLIENFLLDYVKAAAVDMSDMQLQGLIAKFTEDNRNRDRRG